jgi:hypothetical protein
MKTFFKRNVLSILFLLLFIATLLFTYKFGCWPIQEKSTMLYIISTTAQSFAALIGLLATFLVFMIMFIENKRTDISRIISDIFSKYKPGRYPSPTKLEDYYLDKAVCPSFTELNVDDFNNLFEDYKGLKKYRKYVIKYSFYPIILLSIILLISLITFLFIDYLYSNSKAGMIFFTGLLIFSAFSVLEVVIFIINVIIRATDLDKEKNSKKTT